MDHSAQRLVVFGNCIEVGLSGSTVKVSTIAVTQCNTPQLSVADRWPNGAQSVAVRVAVSVYTVVRFEEVNNLADVRVDLRLVRAGNEGRGVVHAGKLGHPDWFLPSQFGLVGASDLRHMCCSSGPGMSARFRPKQVTHDISTNSIHVVLVDVDTDSQHRLCKQTTHLVMSQSLVKSFWNGCSHPLSAAWWHMEGLSSKLPASPWGTTSSFHRFAAEV